MRYGVSYRTKKISFQLDFYYVKENRDNDIRKNKTKIFNEIQNGTKNYINE